MRLTSDIDAN